MLGSLTGITLFIFRRKEPPAPFRVPLFPVIPVAFLGALRIGAVPLPVNPLLPCRDVAVIAVPAAAVESVIDDCVSASVPERSPTRWCRVGYPRRWCRVRCPRRSCRERDASSVERQHSDDAGHTSRAEQSRSRDDHVRRRRAAAGARRPRSAGRTRRSATGASAWKRSAAEFINYKRRTEQAEAQAAQWREWLAAAEQALATR